VQKIVPKTVPVAAESYTKRGSQRYNFQEYQYRIEVLLAIPRDKASREESSTTEIYTSRGITPG